MLSLLERPRVLRLARELYCQDHSHDAIETCSKGSLMLWLLCNVVEGLMLTLLTITTHNDTKKYSWYLTVTWREYIYMKNSASAQIIYHCSTSPGSIPGIVIYIFTSRKDWQSKYIDDLYL